MSDDKYTYETYCESGEVKPDVTVVKPETKPETDLNQYSPDYTNEEISNSLDGSAGEDLSTTP